MINAKDARLFVENKVEQENNQILTLCERYIDEAMKAKKLKTGPIKNLPKPVRLELEKYGYKLREYTGGYAEDNGWFIEW